VFSLLDTLARRLMRRGLRQGLIEGSGAWIAIGAISWLVRLLLRPQAPRVVREDLRLGESIVVRHVVPPARRGIAAMTPAADELA
jgi:hypothetical protein